MNKNNPSDAPTLFLEEVSASQAPPPAGEGRFLGATLLARGGMGELRRAHDTLLERPVVLKRVRDDLERPLSQGQLLREARLQGSFGHPGVVPVYDLATDEQGRAFFVMQEVHGRTLLEAMGSPSWTERRLLEVVGRIAQLLAFVHDRGVVHGDLKPSNVMLGSYGEVYLLDWGAAMKIRSPGAELPEGERPSVLGTPLYMAPEQAMGRAIDGRADLYALGAILFQILSGETLRADGPPEAVMAAAVLDARAGERLARLGVEAELVLLCDRATARRPETRHPTAHAFFEELTAYLDGARTAAERNSLADRLTVEAGALRGPGQRGEALRTLARAVAIAPEHAPAMAALAEALLDEGGPAPPEALRQIEAEDRATGARSAKLALGAHLLWLLLVPPAYQAGLRSPAALALMLGPALATIGLNLVALRRGWSRGLLLAVGVSSYASVGALAGIAGPILFVPTVAIGTATAFLVLASHDRLLRVATLLLAVLAVVVPFSLELAGVVPPSYSFSEGKLVVLPRFLPLTPSLFFPLFLAATLLVLLSSHVTLSALVSEHRRSRREAITQAARLHHLVPIALGQGQDPATPPSTPPASRPSRG